MFLQKFQSFRICERKKCMPDNIVDSFASILSVTSFLHVRYLCVYPLFLTSSISISATHGGGKTSELLCNKPPCNVLNGEITQQ